jgi:predicted dehydrogenase
MSGARAAACALNFSVLKIPGRGIGALNIHRACAQRELRAAVIGAGVFGRHHATKYMRLSGVRLAAVADPDPDARRQVASHLRVLALTNWRDLLGKVDIVSVCSPASTHAEIVRAFLSSGAHVLVEKPIATDLDEADELIQLAADRGLVLTVGHQERFVFAKSGLLDGEVVPLKVECVRAGPWTGRGGDVSVVLDLMIHDLDLVHRLIPSSLNEVRARSRSLRGRLPDEVMAKLVFMDGAEAELFASRAAETRRRSMRVVYADGAIEIDFLARSVANTTGRTLRPLELHDPLGEAVADFIAAIGAGASALVRPEEARRALETALLIEEAAEPAREMFVSNRQALRATA